MDDATSQIVQTAGGLLVRHALTVAAGSLVTDGLVQAGDQDSFIKIGSGIVVGLAAVAWSWWQKSGQAEVQAMLKKMTAKKTVAAAVTTAQALPTGAAVTKALAIFAVLLASLIFTMPAFAQLAPLRPLKPLTGDIAKDIGTSSPNGDAVAPGLPNLLVGGQTKNDLIKLWQSIQKASTADLTYAIAMATLANAQAPKGITTGAAMRLSCLTAIQTLNGQIGGNGLMDTSTPPKPMVRPDPALFTDAETFAEVIDAVQPGGPLWTSCAGAAQLAATSTVAFVNALVSGAAGLALLAPK